MNFLIPDQSDPESQGAPEQRNQTLELVTENDRRTIGNGLNVIASLPATHSREKCEKKMGKKLKAATITTVINPDTGTADVFVFDGFHLRIPWNSPEAKKAYKGTYAYKG